MKPQYIDLDEARQQKRTPDLPVLAVDELMTIDLPDRPRYLPWLPKGGLIQVFGPRGIGKTYFTTTLAISLVTGTRFLKWEVSESAGVLVIDGEMALGEFRERLATLLPGTPVAPLEILSHEYVYNQQERDLNLGLPEWQEEITRYLAEHPDINVIVLDNLACLLPGVAEDKRDEWSNKVLPFLIGLRRRNVSVVMVHHAGKGGEQRGTSAREDSLDTVINLRRVPGYDATQGAQFEVRFTKARGVYGKDVAPIEARLETDQDGAPSWTWAAVEENNETRLLNLVREGIDNVSEAAEEMGLTKGAVSKLKKRLQIKGELKPGKLLVLTEGGI